MRSGENTIEIEDFTALQNLTNGETQGQRLKKIRQSLGLTQSEIGVALSMSKQYFSKAETDTIVLNNRQLVTLLVDYNVNVNYLLAGRGEMFLQQITPPDNITQRLDKIEKALAQFGISIN